MAGGLRGCLEHAWSECPRPAHPACLGAWGGPAMGPNVAGVLGGCLEHAWSECPRPAHPACLGAMGPNVAGVLCGCLEHAWSECPRPAHPACLGAWGGQQWVPTWPASFAGAWSMLGPSVRGQRTRQVLVRGGILRLNVLIPPVFDFRLMLASTV